MDLRSAFPVLETKAYLNTGSCGPVPARSVEAMDALVQLGLHGGRSSTAWLEATAAARSAQREGYARALGAAPEQVALTSSTSEGVVRVLAGMTWAPGDEVVTADDEHPGLLGPLLTLRERRGIAVRPVPLAQVGEAVGPRTRLIACSHVSWVSGALAPDLRGAGVPVLLDGAQGLGAVRVDLEALGCDAYAAAGQKWLCGPGGTGALWVRPGAEVAPLGLTYANLESPADGLGARPWPDARAHDAPVYDPVLAAGAAAALEVLRGDPDRIERGIAGAARLADALRERGRTVAGRGPSTLVAWEDPDPDARVASLAERGVVVRALPRTPYVRASVGGWTSDDDLARLLAGLG